MDKELIKVNTLENGEQAVSAKELYKFLSDDGTHLSRWVKQNITDNYFADVNTDYRVLAIEATTSKGGQVGQDYALTLDFAKELCMLSKCDKGKQARKYFIECERQLKTIKQDSYMIEDPIARAKRWIEEEQIRKDMENKIELDKPKVEFADQVANSSDCADMGEFAKMIKDENINLGRNRLFAWLRVHKYLMKDNIPYQDKITKNMFKVILVTKVTPYGIKQYHKTMVTGQGQIKLVETLRKEFGEVPEDKKEKFAKLMIESQKAKHLTNS